ncbi:MAG: TRAP transporter small permease subunit [Gammaproteobacteria bacterium]
MQRLAVFVSQLDQLNERIGRIVSWLVLGLVLLQFLIVLLRYVFGLGWVVLQEAVIYLHAILFLSAAGYALLHNSHVRCDVFYASATPRRRAWVDLFGALILLLPMCVLIGWLAWPYLAQSWRVLEGSPQGSLGIPAVFLLKSMLLFFVAVLGLQGIALALRAYITLRETT